MEKMTRELALKRLKVALLQGDTKKATRIYIESRISRKVYNDLYRRFYRAATSEVQS